MSKSHRTKSWTKHTCIRHWSAVSAPSLFRQLRHCFGKKCVHVPLSLRKQLQMRLEINSTLNSSVKNVHRDQPICLDNLVWFCWVSDSIRLGLYQNFLAYLQLEWGGGWSFCPKSQDYRVEMKKYPVIGISIPVCSWDIKISSYLLN